MRTQHESNQNLQREMDRIRAEARIPATLINASEKKNRNFALSSFEQAKQ